MPGSQLRSKLIFHRFLSTQYSKIADSAEEGLIGWFASCRIPTLNFRQEFSSCPFLFFFFTDMFVVLGYDLPLYVIHTNKALIHAVFI